MARARRGGVALHAGVHGMSQGKFTVIRDPVTGKPRTVELYRSDPKSQVGIHVNNFDVLISESVPHHLPGVKRVDELGRPVFIGQREKDEFRAMNPDYVEAKDNPGMSVDRALAERAEKQRRNANRAQANRRGNFFMHTRD